MKKSDDDGLVHLTWTDRTQGNNSLQWSFQNYVLKRGYGRAKLKGNNLLEQVLWRTTSSFSQEMHRSNTWMPPRIMQRTAGELPPPRHTHGIPPYPHTTPPSFDENFFVSSSSFSASKTWLHLLRPFKGICLEIHLYQEVPSVLAARTQSRWRQRALQKGTRIHQRGASKQQSRRK